jgi:uncharacterized protein
MTEQRAVSYPFALRDTGGDGLTMAGHAAVFNTPTLINNWEGKFNEQISRGAFQRGINAGKLPVLMFDHGKHPTIGQMPIGAITELREDDKGLFVEARLHDNELVRPVRDAIASGAIRGMSFRFSVPKGKETVDRSGAIPLRTVHEVNCAELGPVVFPAYETTDVLVRAADGDPEALAELAERLKPYLINGTSLEGELAELSRNQLSSTCGLSFGERARVLRSLQLES